MNKLQRIIDKCAASVSLEVNKHIDYYQSVNEYLQDMRVGDFDVPDNVIKGMIESNTVVELQCYPNTPNGFFRIYHYDLEEALDLALSELNE